MERLGKELDRSPRIREADEAKHPWLTLLLDAYYLLTTGTAILLKGEESRRRQTIGCGPGCTGCCLRPEVPICQLEMLGIWWYVAEKLEPGLREKLNQRLMAHRRSIECPFLIDTRCAIYPLRPLACRFLHVFGTPCAPGEIPVESRKGDIWVPREAAPPAILTMLTYFGFNTDEARRKAFEEGYLVSASSPMSSFPWETLATARKK